MIKFSNIGKTFKSLGSETIALKNVNLEIFKGEFLMIMGPSGCGKTTFLSVVAGILKSDEGESIVLGQHYQNSTDDELLAFRSQNIGFIFQSFHLLPTLSVVENIAIPLLLTGHERTDALIQAKKMLKRVGLEGKEDLRPQMLSGGQQQRIAIARSLVNKPKLLICDEPTSALDHATGTSILELMKKINREEKTTFVVVTHDKRIEDYADRIAYMDDGQIIRIETR